MSIGGISVIAWLISDKCKSRSNDRDSFVYAMQWCDSQNRKKPATFLLHPAVIREHQECEWKASIGKFRSDPHWMRSHAKYCRWKKYKTAESISMRPTWNVISEALSCLFAILFIPMMHSNRQMKWLTHYGSPGLDIQQLSMEQQQLRVPWHRFQSRCESRRRRAPIPSNKITNKQKDKPDKAERKENKYRTISFVGGIRTAEHHSRQIKPIVWYGKQQ